MAAGSSWNPTGRFGPCGNPGRVRVSCVSDSAAARTRPRAGAEPEPSSSCKLGPASAARWSAAAHGSGMKGQQVRELSRTQLRGATCSVHGHPDTSECVSAAARSNRSTEAGEPSPQLLLQTGRLRACVRAWKNTHFNFTVPSFGCFPRRAEPGSVPQPSRARCFCPGLQLYHSCCFELLNNSSHPQHARSAAHDRQPRSLLLHKSAKSTTEASADGSWASGSSYLCGEAQETRRRREEKRELRCWRSPCWTPARE